MLILARNIRQAIYIGHDIVIRILDVQGCQVRLGIEAPRSIPVHREEIYTMIQTDDKE
jgi:carbon storage regulator